MRIMRKICANVKMLKKRKTTELLVFTIRFTNECVIISGATKVKPPCELQLASMSALTSKTSSQAFFLRTLKVIIQLRDAIRLSRTRKSGEC